MDNELELVFAVVYQKIIKLPYVDNFLIELQDAFKNKFGDELASSQRFSTKYEFEREFRATLSAAENAAKQTSKAPKAMRSFNESLKSKKTVASLIESPADNKAKDQHKKQVNIMESPKPTVEEKGISNADIIMENRKKLMGKMAGKKSPPENKNKAEKEKAGKKPRVWDLGGNSKDAVVLDRSKDQPEDVQYRNIQNDVSDINRFLLSLNIRITKIYISDCWYDAW